jgi:hypothetical protein
MSHIDFDSAFLENYRSGKFSQPSPDGTSSEPGLVVACRARPVAVAWTRIAPFRARAPGQFRAGPAGSRLCSGDPISGDLGDRRSVRHARRVGRVAGQQANRPPGLQRQEFCSLPRSTIATRFAGRIVAFRPKNGEQEGCDQHHSTVVRGALGDSLRSRSSCFQSRVVCPVTIHIAKHVGLDPRSF